MSALLSYANPLAFLVYDRDLPHARPHPMLSDVTSYTTSRHEIVSHYRESWHKCNQNTQNSIDFNNAKKKRTRD